jgi:DNA processing protein
MYSMRDILIFLSAEFDGNWMRIREEIEKKAACNEREIKACLSKVKSNVITMIDSDYPLQLKNMFRPPFVLYYRGNRDLLKYDACLAVIGSRECTEYGKTAAEKLIGEAYEINKGITVISGMATGIDSISQRAAIAKGGKVISVLGSGLDTCYPKESRDVYDYCSGPNGLVLTEYPDWVLPERENFPARNRLIAGLCTSLLVIEGKESSGTSITTKLALEGGKDILAVPNSILEERDLSNHLIQSGAYACLTGQDIVDSLHGSKN